MSLGHTGCPRGKRVRVKLRSGETIVDRFHERTDRDVFLERRGRIPKRKIRSFTILRRLRSR